MASQPSQHKELRNFCLFVVFAGKDASRALAKSSVQQEDVSADVTGLSEKELKVLDDW